MDNKYRINSSWDQKGPRYMHNVIVDLIDELNKSLVTSMMSEVKSDEEVKTILNNPEGITIKELQVIDVWSIGKDLRRELREELREAYTFLSTKAAKIIADRNEDTVIRDEEGNKNINNKNRELKNTIVNQCQVIEKLVEECEKKGELSEKERKLLVYIRKVYSKALKEAIKNLFSTASISTERAKIFPRDEQEITNNKIRDLRKRIDVLTRESRQKKKNQQKEAYGKLELEKKELETKLTSLKDTLNSSFAELIDNKGKVNREVKMNIVENLSKWEKVQQHLPILTEENNNQEIDSAQEWKEFYLQLETKVEQVNYLVRK